MKKPYLVYALAVVFLLSPVGNILLSLWSAGLNDWMEPGKLSHYLGLIPFLDWFWFALVFLSGCALFRPHKLTWSFAMVTLGIVLGIHVYKAVFVRNGTSTLQDVHFYAAFLTTAAAAAIGLHFRFPYLDRRSNWWGNLRRFETSLPVRFQLGSGIPGVLKEISESGAFVQLDAAHLSLFKSGQLCSLEILQEIKVTLDVEVAHVRSNGLALKIKAFVSGAPDAWKNYLNKLKVH